jgi:flagellar P-ring protein precursor FlgI
VRALLLGLGLLVLALADAAAAGSVRLKDLVEVDGVRGNDLVGYGLVVGLDGTGDGIRNAPFTEEILSGTLERLGVNVSGEQIRPRNVAAVIVTATLPPFARAGSRIGATVSAIGDASSLLGGTLVMTPLNAADGEIYAVAQGPILAGGAAARGEGSRTVEGVPTSGSIPTGARVEREVDFDFGTLDSIRLALRTPDFTTAARIEETVNAVFPRRIARMLDSGTVQIDIGAAGGDSPSRVMARIENLTVNPDVRARVVIDQRSGTIVMGAEVRIDRVAVSQGNLTLRVEEAPVAVQPNPFAPGETIVLPRTTTSVAAEPGLGLVELPPGASLTDIVAGLNALGVAPRDLIDILKALHATGALHADLIAE